MDVTRAFELFGELVQKRFERIINGEASISDVSHESEDTIRYTLFYALTKTLDVHPEFVFLEYPHPYVPARRNPKLDTFIEAHRGIPSMAFEMKLTLKNLENGHGVPKTQTFGMLISDLIRLAYIPDVERKYFVWVFDGDMGVYFCNRKDKWVNFVEGNTFEFTWEDVVKLPKTAKGEVVRRIGRGINVGIVGVLTVYARNFTINGRSFGIRVYEVNPEVPPVNSDRLPGNLCRDFKKTHGITAKGEYRRITGGLPCTGSKYLALYEWLRNTKRERFVISLDELESRVRSINPNFSLPPASRKHVAWWANHRGNVQAGCGWLFAGWRAKPIVKGGRIVGVEFLPV